MVRSTENPWLHRYAVLTAAATLGLICLGGLVTSRGAGLAVPDWPTTYGYNMFFFPISKWVGGAFYEHTHRLAASGVGLMTVILAVWLWLKEARRWVRWLGVVAVVAVVLQGVLGGLRVTELLDELGFVHGTLAQLFLVLLSALALVTTRWWVVGQKLPVYEPHRLRYGYLLISVMILFQLTLGAAMRHQHAGLAVPDFPRAYGRWWPEMAPAAITRYNQTRLETTALKPITAFQVGLHMVHRLTALGLFLAVATAAWLTGRWIGWRTALGRLSLLWLGLISVQMVLGMATVWTNKSADFATAHVAGGALCLTVGSLLFLMAGRCLPGPKPGLSQPAQPQLAGGFQG